MRVRFSSKPARGYILAFAVLLIAISPGFSQCTLTWYQDSDGDGFGRSDVSTVVNCSDPAPAGYVLNDLDCNDNSVNSQVWTVVGGTAASSAAVTATVTAVTEDNTPFVLYRHFSGATAPLTAKKFNGTTWETLGNDPLSPDYLYGADMAIDNTGTPYISYIDFDPVDATLNKLSVLKYDGAAWVQVGLRRFSVEIPSGGKTSITFDSNDVPHVAVVDMTNNLICMKYDAGAWTTVGATGETSNPTMISIRIDDSDVPYIAYAENSDGKISVIKYSGGVWSQVGIASFSDNDIDFPSIRIDGTGTPYVNYFDYGTNQVVVQQFSLGTWQKVGSAVFTGTSSSIAFDIGWNDVPYVVYRNNATQRFTVRRWTGTTWQIVGTSEFVRGLDVSMAVGPTDNIPYISLRETSDGDKAKTYSLSPAPSLPSTPTLQATPNTICFSESSTVSIMSGNLNDATEWRWYTSSCGGTAAGTGTSINVSPGSTTTYYVRGEGTCVPTPGSCANISVTVNPLPVIDTQPNPTAQVCETLNQSISLTTSEPNLSYQWYVNSGSGWTIMTGENSNTLNLTNVPFSFNNNQYRNIVTNTLTNCQSTSTSLALTVNTLPVISVQPAASSTICEGNPLNLSVTTDPGMDFQWDENNGSWSAMASETSGTLSIASVAYAMDNYQYRVTVTNPVTNCSSLSTTSLLRVNQSPAIATDPAPSTICDGANTNFTVSATGTNLGYQWQRNTGSGWSDIAGQVTSSLSVNAATTAQDGHAYRAVVTNTGCVPATSQPAQLTVQAPPQITQDPGSQTVCAGSNTSFTSAASGTSLTYQWQLNTGSGWNDMAGENAATLSLTSVGQLSDGYMYRIIADNTGCNSATSSAAELRVNQSPTIATDPAPSTICDGANTSFTVSATGTNLGYQWQRNTGSGWSDIVGQVTSSLSVNAATTAQDGHAYRAVVTNTGCVPATSQPAQLTVQAPPQITQNPGSQTICAGSNASFTGAASGTGLTYQWQVNDGSGWNDMAGENAATLSLTAVDQLSDGHMYRIIADNTGCSDAVSQAATLTVTSAPVITTSPTNTTACEGADASFTVAGANNTSLRWQMNATGSWEDISGATNATLTLQNVSLTMGGNNYRAVLTAPSCPEVASNAATLTILSQPSITEEPQSTSACEGDDVPFNVTATGQALTYQWQENAGSDWTNMAGEQGTRLLLNNVSALMTANRYRVVVQSATCGSITSGEASFSIDPLQCNDELVIAEGVSPNGDGSQDHWILHGIEQYPDNFVRVFNIWGDLIFETQSYDNGVHAWHGQSNQGFAGNGVPDGTYYYIIDLGHTDIKPLRGFVVLKR